MRSQAVIAHDLAAALLGGVWTRRGLLQRASAYLDDGGKVSTTRLVDEILKRTADRPPPSPKSLKAMILESRWFDRAAAVRLRSSAPLIAVLEPPRFTPAPGAALSGVPEIATPGDLARWLETPVARLDWLADLQRRHHATATPMFQNYRYRFIAKPSGGARLIETPKSDLLAIQRKILREILDRAPVHGAAHGFVRGRSCLTGAARHVGEAVVACIDISDFFGSVQAQRIHALFRRFGYPWAVARLLTGLCTTSTPAAAFNRAPQPSQFDWRTRNRLGAPHLPQGAPTSPALANLVVGRLDRRIDGIARQCGAHYTRYADDLTFSGDDAFAHRVASFLESVADIVRDEGFAVNAQKTRIMRRGARQVVTGVVVNERLNVRRAEYDALKAVLHNCAMFGAQTQNRAGHADFAAHLAGRVTWIEALHPERGARLRALYDRVTWA